MTASVPTSTPRAPKGDAVFDPDPSLPLFDPGRYLREGPRGGKGKRALQRAGQRALLCRCMVELAAAEGYEGATVQKSVRLSGLGKGTFYGLFEDSEACLLEAFERCAEAIFGRVSAAGHKGGTDFAGQLGAGLGELLELLASEPDVARFVLVEIRAGGTECREAEQRWLQRFATLLIEADAAGGGSEGLARMAVGAISSRLALRVAKAGPEAPAGMVDELVEVALLAHCGARSGAAAGFQVATPAPPRGAPKTRRKAGKGTRVVASKAQRQLLLLAIAELVGARGYRATRVEDVAKRAKLSKSAFYVHFAGKEECFLAAFDAAVERIAERARATMAGEGALVERTETGLRALLESFMAQPGLARLLTVEVRKVGAAGEARYSETLARFARLFTEADGDRQAGVKGDVSQLVAASVAGAIAREVGEGRAGQLAGLLPELLFTALAPCLGGEQAATEMRRVAEEKGVASG